MLRALAFLIATALELIAASSLASHAVSSAEQIARTMQGQSTLERSALNHIDAVIAGTAQP